ncbi:MAG: hypothetical protein OEO23_13610, partial [Gemmatimonadota bacterium]|nr:hypothetical protein [Gemmatimonadota bacterium]
DVVGVLRLVKGVSRAGWAPALAVCILASCATSPSRAGIQGRADGTASHDPTGIYDVTLASQGMVSEGTMTLRGVPGDYRGTLSVSGFSAEIGEVEVGEADMQIRARTDRGMLILRLLRDGSFLSGNWILGEGRGTVTAEKRQASNRSA